MGRGELSRAFDVLGRVGQIYAPNRVFLVENCCYDKKWLHLELNYMNILKKDRETEFTYFSIYTEEYL